MTSTVAADTSWCLHEGDAITPELTALRLLGGGSAYEAFLAFDEITYGPVVVKVVRPSEVDDPETLHGLEREATALDVAHHPVVVRGLRHSVDGPRPHLVLEHVEGPRLSTLIRRYGRLSEQQYLPLAIDIASALHYFRHADVCHLDIKPSNLIMGSPARLIDLSVARSSDAAAAINGIIGTDAYLAPEQAAPGEAGKVPGFASDVWGLGATLFHAIAGERPFPEGDRDAPTPVERHPQVAVPPGPLPSGVAPEVSEVVYAALEPRAADRPLPHEIAEALEPVLARQPKARLTFKVNARPV
ncbi:serine/threonine-protein kinase [Nocardioides bizhenqiangii]|uniref:Serine/threonine-protein kinase n=1 Tax=Nocardioides bizhenqiangii TaxID=3095076 RepID=A0ABZ0ZX73_9ACTN|nr:MULTISPECIES: serine/threonine-protein kinase [unclassified Nocardioides]MDZ5622515.1 serine/threonine-protein kinase [Nocardioides sp. HM23]WQQ28326.1 serine/threonine-protein kinase [Nocardioides sp. HM61]